MIVEKRVAYTIFYYLFVLSNSPFFIVSLEPVNIFLLKGELPTPYFIIYLH